MLSALALGTHAHQHATYGVSEAVWLRPRGANVPRLARLPGGVTVLRSKRPGIMGRCAAALILAKLDPPHTAPRPRL